MIRSIVTVLFGLFVCCGCGVSGLQSYPGTIECGGVTLILVPKGERVIGTNNSRAMPQERPACLYRLDKVLYIGQTEVTVAQCRALLHGIPFEDLPLDAPALVEWKEAKKFCARFQDLLEHETGRRWEVRLPWEAEWEYAARYGRPPMEDWWPTAIGEGWFGEENYGLWDHAWFAANSEGKLVHPVAQKKPNPLGLYDMLGNVPEWCEGYLTTSVTTMLKEMGKPDSAFSPQSSYYYGADGFNWLCRPARGDGGLCATEDDCRPSSRMPHSTVGFRIVALPR